MQKWGKAGFWRQFILALLLGTGAALLVQLLLILLEALLVSRGAMGDGLISTVLLLCTGIGTFAGGILAGRRCAPLHAQAGGAMGIVMGIGRIMICAVGGHLETSRFLPYFLLSAAAGTAGGMAAGRRKRRRMSM